MKREERNRQLQEDAEASQKQCQNLLEDPVLSENPNQATSTLAPGRIIHDRYKGMTPQQIYAIREEQKRQIEEKRLAAERERQEELQYARQMEEIRKLVVRSELEHAQEEAKRKKQLQETIKLQQREHREHERQQREDAKQKPEDSYFCAFGRSAR